MRISDWSSDVCSSDLHVPGHHRSRSRDLVDEARYLRARDRVGKTITEVWKDMPGEYPLDLTDRPPIRRSEEHTSELQSLMRISYAVFCLKKKIINIYNIQNETYTY